MNITPSEPLSNEERELATLLSRLGPHAEPSPQLDARILAAAHEALPRPAPRAARVRSSMFAGLAASVVLTAGIAWQLRPTQPATAYSDVASARIGSPPPGSVAQSAAEIRQVPSADAVETRAPALAEDAAMAPAADSVAASAAQPERAPRTFAGTRPEPELPRVAVPAPGAPAKPPPPAPAAPMASAPVEQSAMQRKLAAGADALQGDAAREARAGARSEATARRTLRAAPISERMQQDTTGAGGAPSRARQTELQVPVAADAQLQVDDWLERVRTRYGLGDEEAARRSLMLFVQDHPTEPVPGDLEPLLDE